MGELDKRGGSLQRPESSQMMGNGSPCTLRFGEGTPLATNPSFLAPDLGRTHFLASVLAGLLRGQLSDQQWLQELAHKIQVAVEGAEGILGSRWEVVSQGHGLQPASQPREGRLTSRTSVGLARVGPKCSLRPHPGQIPPCCVWGPCPNKRLCACRSRCSGQLREIHVSREMHRAGSGRGRMPEVRGPLRAPLLGLWDPAKCTSYYLAGTCLSTQGTRLETSGA